MSEGEVATSDFTSEMVAVALREKERVDARLAELDAETELVKKDRRRIDGVLRALNGAASKPGRKPQAAQPKPFKMSEEKRARAMEFLTGNQSEITSQTLREALNISGSMSASMLGQFRLEGIVRLAATQGNMNIYRSEV